MNILQNFSDFVKSSKSIYNVKLTEISASTLDSRAFSARVLQYSSWVEDGLMNVVYQLHAGTGKMSDYLGVKYPRNIEETELRERGFPRRTLLFRIRYLLRSLMACSYEPARFQSWQFAGMEQLLEIFADQMEQALGEGACPRLVEFIDRFKRLWSPVSKDRDSRDALVAELGRLLDVVLDAFQDLQISFFQHECENLRQDERKGEIDEMAENVKAVRASLDNAVAPTMKELGETVGRIERRQCRRKGVSAPVSLTAQDRCEALWNECKAHPEMIGKNAEGRRVRKIDAFECLMKNHRLPPSVTTYTGFARAVELAQKRRRKKTADVGNCVVDVGNCVGNCVGNRVGNPSADGGNLRDSILAIIRGDPGISAAKIGSRLGVSDRTVERQLDSLKKEERLYRVGGTRGHWVVL